VAKVAAGVIKHLILDHPAFEVAGFVLFLSLIGRELTLLGAELDAAGPRKSP
jgi:hypothetical protein